MEIVPNPHPAYAAGMVPIISRFAIRKQVSRLDESRKGRYRLLRVATSTSVQVSPEDTWVSLTAQEDHGIRDWLEVWGDPTLELLANLLCPSVNNRLGKRLVWERTVLRV